MDIAWNLLRVYGHALSQLFANGLRHRCRTLTMLVWTNFIPELTYNRNSIALTRVIGHLNNLLQKSLNRLLTSATPQDQNAVDDDIDTRTHGADSVESAYGTSQQYSDDRLAIQYAVQSLVRDVSFFSIDFMRRCESYVEYSQHVYLFDCLLCGYYVVWMHDWSCGTVLLLTTYCHHCIYSIGKFTCTHFSRPKICTTDWQWAVHISRRKIHWICKCITILFNVCSSSTYP